MRDCSPSPSSSWSSAWVLLALLEMVLLLRPLLVPADEVVVGTSEKSHPHKLQDHPICSSWYLSDISGGIVAFAAACTSSDSGSSASALFMVTPLSGEFECAITSTGARKWLHSTTYTFLSLCCSLHLGSELDVISQTFCNSRPGPRWFGSDRPPPSLCTSSILAFIRPPWSSLLSWSRAPWGM